MICKHCNEDLPIDHFKKDNRTKSGVTSKCRACVSLYNKENRHKWSGQEGGYCPDRYKRTKERRIQTVLEWQKRNPDKVNAISALRRARKLDQTPDLTVEEQQRIQDLYWLARDLRAVSGQDYHVDHIIPISRGGLHHPDNLQILPADINLSKGAKHPPIPQGLNTKVKDL